jgi:deoxyribose-phosphate aldolase
MPMTTMETPISRDQLAGAIDHTLLKPEATRSEVLHLCEEAVAHGFHAVCVNPRWLSLVADRLQGTPVKAGGVVSLPLGADTTSIKAAQAREAVRAGADEIDMVADLAAIVEADADYVRNEFAVVRGICHAVRPPVVLKVIIESAALTHDQKILACQIARQSEVDFVKTSTGLHRAGGATVEDVRLLREAAPGCRIKAAGGIRTAEQTIAMLRAGADRIGTSAGVRIVAEWARTGSG